MKITGAIQHRNGHKKTKTADILAQLLILLPVILCNQYSHVIPCTNYGRVTDPSSQTEFSLDLVVK